MRKLLPFLICNLVLWVSGGGSFAQDSHPINRRVHLSIGLGPSYSVWTHRGDNTSYSGNPAHGYQKHLQARMEVSDTWAYILKFKRGFHQLDQEDLMARVVQAHPQDRVELEMEEKWWKNRSLLQGVALNVPLNDTRTLEYQVQLIAGPVELEHPEYRLLVSKKHELGDYYLIRMNKQLGMQAEGQSQIRWNWGKNGSLSLYTNADTQWVNFKEVHRREAFRNNKFYDPLKLRMYKWEWGLELSIGL